MPRLLQLAAGRVSPTAAALLRLTRDTPSLRRPKFKPCSFRQRTATRLVRLLHSQLLQWLASGLSGSAEGGSAQKAANRQTPPMTGSGSEGEAEDRAQGGGGRPVRVRRAEARAGQGAVFRDEAYATRIGCGWRGRSTLPPGGRDEGETRDPRAKTCHARAISPPPAERTASGRERIRQDSPPTAYMHTPSGATDAEAASPEAGVPLRRNRPHADKAPNARPRANGIAQRLGMLLLQRKIGEPP